MEEFVLCIDIGTSSVKAALVGFKGKVCCNQKLDYSTFAETNKMAEVWEQSVAQLVDCIRKKIGKKWAFVKAVCISGNGPTLVLQDKTTLLWNHKINFELPSFGKSLFLPRLFAFKKLFPEQFNKSDKIFSGPEYLIYSMTGNAVTILPQNSFEDFYWPSDLKKGDWQIQLEQKGITQTDLQKLGSFVLSGTIAGTCKNSFFNLDNLPVICGAPDFVSALIGTGTFESGKLCNRAGSSEGFNLCCSKPIVAENIRCMPSVINGLWNASTLIADTGKDFFELFSKGCGKKVCDKVELKNYCNKILTSFETLKKAALSNGEIFPDKIVITGGQCKIQSGIKYKKKLLGVKIYRTQIADAELLGNGCIGFVALKKYNSLQEAVKNIVCLKKI